MLQSWPGLSGWWKWGRRHHDASLPVGVHLNSTITYLWRHVYFSHTPPSFQHDFSAYDDYNYSLDNVACRPSPLSPISSRKHPRPKFGIMAERWVSTRQPLSTVTHKDEGNIPQLLDRFSWKFQDELQMKYKSIVKLKSIFGVSLMFNVSPAH